MFCHRLQTHSHQSVQTQNTLTLCFLCTQTQKDFAIVFVCLLLSGQWDILQADKSVFHPVQVSLLAQACFYFSAFIRLQWNGLHAGNVFEEAKISNQLPSSSLWLTCTTRTFVSLPFCTKTRQICVFACVFTYPWAAQLGTFVNRWRVVAFGCLAYVCIKVCAGGVFPLASLRQSKSPRMTTSDWIWLKNCANVVECCHEWGIKSLTGSSHLVQHLDTTLSEAVYWFP